MRKPSSMIRPMLGSAAMIAALYTILFSGIRNFNSEDAERMLAELSQHFTKESTRRGKEAKLQYSAVETQGFAYDKTASISNLSLDFIYQQWQGGRRFGISTDEMDLLPDQANPARLVMRFANALNLISSSELLARIQPAKPVLYAVNLKPSKDEAIIHRIVVPGNINITTLEPRREFYLKLKDPLQAEIAFYELQQHLRAQVKSGAMQTLLPTGSWRVGGVDLRYESLQRSAEAVKSKGTIAINDLAFTFGNIVSPPYNATAAWAMKEQRNISGATDSAQIVIEHGLLASGDMKISANGTLYLDIDDSMYGELVFEITNPAAFLQSSWILPAKRAAARDMLVAITGDDDMESHTQLIISLERDKNGRWQVGKQPLDALLEKGLMDMFIFGKGRTT